MVSAPGRAERWFGGAVVLLLAVPFVAVLVVRVGRPVTFVQDLAVIALRSRDVASGHWVLTGPWSRDGFAHPGPLFYWLLGVPSALSGGRHWSLIAGSAVLHMVAIVGTCLVAWRRGGALLTMLMGLVVAACYLSVSGWALIAPWNIWLALPYFLLFLLLAWSVAIGDVVLLPWLLLVGTFLTQTHLGYIPLVSVGVAWAGIRGWLAIRARPGTSAKVPVAISVVLLAVCWVPVAIDELFVTRNLSAIGHYLVNTTETKAGVPAALGWFAAEFQVVPPWLGGPSRVAEFTLSAEPASWWWLLIPLALLGTGWWAALRRRDHERRILVELATAMLGVGLAAMAGVTGDAFDYLFAWRVTLAVFLVAAVVWALIPLAPARDTWRWAGELGMVALLAAATVLTGRVIDFRPQLGSDDHMISRLVAHAEPHAPRGPFWVRAMVGEPLGVAETLIERLDRHGRNPRVDEAIAFKYGQNRAGSIRTGDTVWLVSESAQVSARLVAIPGLQVVTQTTPLPFRAQARLDDLQRAMFHQLHRRHLDQYVHLMDSPLFGYIVRNERRIDHHAADQISALDTRLQRRGPCHCVIAQAVWNHRLHKALDALEAGRR